MLTAISPVDGRYASKTKDFAQYFSEYGLIRYRVFVEIQYFLALLPHRLKPLANFPEEKIEEIEKIIKSFNEEDAEAIKRIEKETNHDVKAVEYFLRKRFEQIGLEAYGEMIHFGLTSQDINNTAVPLSIKDGLSYVLIPAMHKCLDTLQHLSRQWKDIPILARTHGQPASPTMMGKELYVFVHRMTDQVTKLESLGHYAKFGGAVGNLNAHYVTFPDKNWGTFADQFIQGLGLRRIPYTTQIDTYDHMAEIFQSIMRINTILIDLCRDIWTYISMQYFTQKIKSNEVGSSTMPHKVNPIDFENAEGNLGIANALLGHLAEKLPISRLQRDLTDSTVLRNVGVPFAHSLIALKSISKGLHKLEINEQKMAEDLVNNWAVVAEAYQSILRREGVDKPYELLKSFTRGKGHLSEADMKSFIETLPVTDEVRQELREITPANYTGRAELP